ncbi:hypothetical protein KPH14_000698, partial [Odynerus spinipes]
MSETKLNDRHKIYLNNHQIVRTDRPNTRHGGGTAIAIHNKFSYTTIHHPNSRNNKVIEFTTIKIKINAQKSLLFISLYATQNSTNTFIKELNNLVEDSNLANNNVFYVIAGDFNARNTTWNDSITNDRGRHLSQWIDNNCVMYKATLLSPLNPTFHKSGSYLDHCIIDMRLTIEDLINGKLQTLPYDSDHNALYLTLNLDNNDINMADLYSTLKPSPNFKKANWGKFKEYINNNLSHKLCIPPDRNLSLQEIDQHINLLESTIGEAIEATIPKKTKRDYNYYLKYDNKKITKLHTTKSFLISRLFNGLATSSQEKRRLKAVIKRINKTISKELKKTVTAYWQSLIRNINYKNPLEFFPKINRFLRPRKHININTLKIPLDNSQFSMNIHQKYAHLITDNTIIASDPLDKLDIIGTYLEGINSPRYTNQGTDIKERVDNTINKIMDLKNHIRNNNQTFTSFSNNNLAFLPENNDEDPKFLVNYIEVQAILGKLKNKTSTGPDNIPNVVLKNLPETIIKDYTIIFNNAINNAYYPIRWKTAKVLPILKKGKNPEAPQSYRPISLTMSISKVYERLIKKQLDAYIADKNIIPDNQFGFKRGHSTIHALNKFLSDISNSLHNNLIVGAVLLDQEKAFDSVWLFGLIYKLFINNFPIGFILLMLDMLLGKCFYTWDGSALSNTLFKIEEGLQQGTVLSPTLFNIYDSDTNIEAELLTENMDSISFADDRVIYGADNDMDALISRLQTRVNKINEHYINWNLKINALKSETIFFRKPV